MSLSLSNLHPDLLLSNRHCVRLERLLRGYLDQRHLQKCHAVVISFGKSGRTWLRVMLSRFYQRKYGLREHALLEFDNLHRQCSAVPKIFFTHDNYLRDFTGDGASKRAFSNTRAVLLVRHPIDVAVSQYFHWRNRMRRHKMLLNGYPLPEQDVALYDFVSGEAAGLPKIITFLNEWAAACRTQPILVVRYEDMQAQPHEELARILEFVGTTGTAAEIADAVDYASFDKMRKREASAGGETRRLTPGDPDDPDSYKTRRGKVGGYRDYVTPEQAAELEQRVALRLDAEFGYGIPDVAPAAHARSD